MLILTKPFLITFLKGCLIGFFASLLTKTLSYFINQEPFVLNFDLVFWIFILLGGIVYASILTRKNIAG